MQLAVIDGMGGGLGARITSGLSERLAGHEVEIIALGTNARATSTMLEAGADWGASRDNAIQVMCERVDIVVGPVGIMIPNSMMGEISPEVAEAVASTGAERFLLAIDQPHFELIGTGDESLNELLQELIDAIEEHIVSS